MVVTTTSSYAFEKVFMDIVGPLPRSRPNNYYIITLQDDLTKCSCATPAENHETNTVAHIFVTKFVCLYGMPNKIVTDCGTEFLSNVFNEVCRLLKIKSLQHHFIIHRVMEVWKDLIALLGNTYAASQLRINSIEMIIFLLQYLHITLVNTHQQDINHSNLSLGDKLAFHQHYRNLQNLNIIMKIINLN
uniref:Retrovirus-related Pol polyprotein n=1 Tax=Sipha flava TaxID=143950 RepID=A0A2S2QEK8_9HEMI